MIRSLRGKKAQSVNAVSYFKAIQNPQYIVFYSFNTTQDIVQRMYGVQEAASSILVTPTKEMGQFLLPHLFVVVAKAVFTAFADIQARYQAFARQTPSQIFIDFWCRRSRLASAMRMPKTSSALEWGNSSVSASA